MLGTFCIVTWVRGPGSTHMYKVTALYTQELHVLLYTRY